MTLGRCPLGIFCSRGIPPTEVPRVWFNSFVHFLRKWFMRKWFWRSRIFWPRWLSPPARLSQARTYTVNPSPKTKKNNEINKKINNEEPRTQNREILDNARYNTPRLSPPAQPFRSKPCAINQSPNPTPYIKAQTLHHE